MLSVAEPSKVGSLDAWVEVWADVATPRVCQCDLRPLAGGLLLLLDLEALVAAGVSVVVTEELHAVAGSEEASEVTDQIFVVEEAASDTKAGEALVGEVGMVVVLLTAMVMVQRPLLMRHQVLEAEEDLVVGTVASLSTVV